MLLEVGQIWKDKDRRNQGRELVITNIGRGELEGTEPYVLVKDIEKGRYTLIRKDRLLSCKYEFTGRKVNVEFEEKSGDTGNNHLPEAAAVS